MPELPREIRVALNDFFGDVGSELGPYGRPQVAADYAAMLLEREEGTRLSKALGGSRHPRAEAARTLLTRSPWEPFAVAEGLLRRLHAWRRPDSYVWSVAVTALRERLHDDEPRFNVIVISAAVTSTIAVPVMVNIAEAPIAPADELVMRQAHALDHLRHLSPQRRLVSFGAASPGNRYQLHLRGWRYLQVMPPAESRWSASMDVIRPGEDPVPLNEFRAQLLDEGHSGGVEFIGTVSLDGDVPDWPEGIYAYVHRALADVHIRVTNIDPYSPELDQVVLVALHEPYVTAHLDLLGAGLYRGPSYAALMRHVGLVLATTGFIMERLAHGCGWALERHQFAARRYMDRFLRETAAMGEYRQPGAEERARRIIEEGDDSHLLG